MIPTIEDIHAATLAIRTENEVLREELRQLMKERDRKMQAVMKAHNLGGYDMSAVMLLLSAYPVEQKADLLRQSDNDLLAGDYKSASSAWKAFQILWDLQRELENETR